MTYQEVEQYGIQRLHQRATDYEVACRAADAKATEAALRNEPFMGLRKTAAAHHARAKALHARAEDGTRYLWRIAVSGYGPLYWVGTDASAEGRRALKAAHEGAVATVERMREALPTEDNGEWLGDVAEVECARRLLAEAGGQS